MVGGGEEVGGEGRRCLDGGWVKRFKCEKRLGCECLTPSATIPSRESQGLGISEEVDGCFVLAGGQGARMKEIRRCFQSALPVAALGEACGVHRPRRLRVALVRRALECGRGSL